MGRPDAGKARRIPRRREVLRVRRIFRERRHPGILRPPAQDPTQRHVPRSHRDQVPRRQGARPGCQVHRRRRRRRRDERGGHVRQVVERTEDRDPAVPQEGGSQRRARHHRQGLPPRCRHPHRGRTWRRVLLRPPIGTGRDPGPGGEPVQGLERRRRVRSRVSESSQPRAHRGESGVARVSAARAVAVSEPLRARHEQVRRVVEGGDRDRRRVPGAARAEPRGLRHIRAGRGRRAGVGRGGGGALGARRAQPGAQRPGGLVRG